MKGDERLGSGYWLAGILIIAGAVYYWNQVHPFGQEAAPLSPAPATPAIEAQEAIEAPPFTEAPVTAKPADPANPGSSSSEGNSTAAAAPAESAAPDDAPQLVINYSNLVQNKTYWPKIIHVKIDTIFPAVIEGKQIGTVTANAGSEVTLVKVTGEKSLQVRFGATEATIDADTTDFEEVVYAKFMAAKKK